MASRMIKYQQDQDSSNTLFKMSQKSNIYLRLKKKDL